LKWIAGPKILHFFNFLPTLPYHHDWKLAFQAEFGLSVHWFGRYGGYPEWEIPASRLAADMVAFFFVEKSSCWAVVNGRRHDLHDGDLLIVSGADEFSYGHDPQQPHTSLSACLALRQGLLTNLLLQVKFERRYAWARPAQFSREFEKALGAFTGAGRWRDLQVAAAVLHWLAYVMDGCGAPMDRSLAADRGVVDRILTAEAWANARLKQTITLGEWARAVRLNPIYFGRVFKRETGLRPMAWLNQRRLQLAGQLLAGTRKSVTDISEACGFTTPYYFSRVFRRHFGQSPLVYRKARH
jgi:AraC-like DNA-binding protein